MEELEDFYLTSYYSRSVIANFSVHLNTAFAPQNKGFLALIDTFDFTQFVQEPTHCSVNTLDMILSRGKEVSALNFSSVSSMDHFLIKFEATLACPCNAGTDVFTTFHIGPATLTALN